LKQKILEHFYKNSFKPKYKKFLKGSMKNESIGKF